MIEYIFVYGTLRRDAGHVMHGILAKNASFVGNAVYQGRLYMIETYPGAVPEDDPQCLVHGEVYRLDEIDAALPTLDEYEQCGELFLHPTEYERKKQIVHLKDGGSIEAWVYLYNRPTIGLNEITSGDFLSTM